ncbi:MAG: hypothetical protein AMJ53_01945, partial [Gammaproteobacteria bacterium SG8_11]
MINKENISFADSRFRPKGFQWIIYAVGLILITALLFKHQFDITTLKNEYIADIEQENALVAEKINDRLGNIHQGLHTLAHLPGITSAIKNHGKFDPVYQRVVEELYSLLHSSIKLTELYIVPSGFDPTKMDPRTGEYQKPLFKFEKAASELDHADHHHDPASGTSVHVTSTSGDDESLEMREYLEIQNQLDFFSDQYPNSHQIQHHDYPARLSDEIQTADHEKGLIYSLPIYDETGELSGAVSSIVETKTIQQILHNGRYVLHNPKYQLSIVPNNGGAWQTSLNWYTRNMPNPELLYSNTTRLDIHDHDTWYLWIGVSEQEFNNSERVIKTTFFNAVALLVITLTTLGIVFYTSMLARRNR